MGSIKQLLLYCLIFLKLLIALYSGFIATVIIVCLNKKITKIFAFLFLVPSVLFGNYYLYKYFEFSIRHSKILAIFSLAIMLFSLMIYYSDE